MAKDPITPHLSRRPALEHPHVPFKPQPHLGVAGNVARFFIDSPLSPLLFVAALFVGLIGLVFTPRQEDPEISVPMIDIFIQYEGASPQQVSNLAIDPLERIMSEIPGVKHVYSAAQREQGIVTVRFKVGEQLGPSIVKVHDKIQSNMDRIPPGVAMPLVKPKGIDDVPVVTLTLWSESAYDSELRTLAQRLLQRIKEVPETGQGFVVGGRTQQIRIEVLPERLSGFDISLDQIAQTVRAANQQQGKGNMEQGAQVFDIYSGSFLRSASDVSRLVVAVHDDRPVYIRDIAEVIEGPSELEQIVAYYDGVASEDKTRNVMGAPAVTIAIAKKEGSNGVVVANAILDKLAVLKDRLIPDNVNITVTRNYGKTANDKVNELLEALLVAAVVVSFLCWIAIGARPAIVVITVIPVVILLTIWATWVLGYTINRVSLFALIFSIGILVDDATVVVENIFRRWLHADTTDLNTAVDAVREVGNPTIIATMTILAALLPMGFVSGMMGPYMLPIPLLGSLAMTFSLIAAFIFTPWWSVLLKPKLGDLKQAEERERKTQEGIGRFYRPIIEPLIENRKLSRLFLLVIIGLFFLACSLFAIRAVTVKMLPFDNKPEFNVVINMPEGTALLATSQVAQKLAKTLREIPEVTALQTYTGTSSPFNFNGMVRHYYMRNNPWEADIQVMLLDKDDRKRSSHQIAMDVRTLITPIAQEMGARIAVVEMPPGPPVLQTMVAEIYGPDDTTRRQVAKDMAGLFETASGLVDVDTYMIEPYNHWVFEIDTEKATRRGISVETINRNVLMAMGGYKLGDIKGGSSLEPVYLVMQFPLMTRSDLDQVGNLPIAAPDGKSVPLAELGKFHAVDEQPIIYHKDLRPMEYVVGEMEGRFGAPIYGMMEVEDLLNEYTTPDGVKMSGTLTGAPEDDLQSGFEWSGEWVVTYETFRDMGIAFAAALVLIYMLLVLEFDNFMLPAIIMAPIPLTLIGIIPGHWLLDAEFTATSLIGFIALAGIQVRSSILLVDFTKNELHRGSDIREAVVSSGQIRMRPIWVTSLTLMAGSAAILFDPIFEGMAISLLFGSAVATALTLIVIPLGCISANKVFHCAIEREDMKAKRELEPVNFTETIHDEFAEDEWVSIEETATIEPEPIPEEASVSIRLLIINGELQPTIKALTGFATDGNKLDKEAARDLLEDLVKDGVLEKRGNRYFLL